MANKVLDCAKELDVQARELLEKVKTMQTELSSSLQSVKRAESELVEKERQAEKERIEKEKAERLRAFLDSESDLAVHVGADEPAEHAATEATPVAANTDSHASAAPEAVPVKTEKPKPAPAPTEVKDAVAEEKPQPAQTNPAPVQSPAAEARPSRPAEEKPAQGGYQQRPVTPRPAGDRPAQGGYQQQPAQGGYQQGATQGGYQQRPAQGGYQQRPTGDRPAQGGYQQRSAQGGYQQRPTGDRPAQGGYQQRPAQGGYQQRPAQGGYQQRPAQGGYQQRPTGDRPAQGGYQQRPAGGPARSAGASATPGYQARPAANTTGAQRPRTGTKPGQSREEERRAKSKKAMMKENQRMGGWEDDDTNRKQRRGKQQIHKPEPVVIDKVTLTTETITVKDLSEKIGKPAAEIIKKLFILGIMATINQEIDYDTCSLIGADYGIEIELNVTKTAEDVLNESVDEVDTDDDLVTRPPVVTIMGHVDHGKTSLLDAFRESSITEGEAGGITQHIGAYTVKCNGRIITFIDTPGHEAFTSMRARGAQVTDIVILVVAADDGIMPQTVEAINHAKAAKVPIIVAINKMDKPTADPGRVKQQLTEHGLVSEEWGGDTICVEVSAKKRMNLDALLEMVLLQADVLELRANPARAARGTIIEAELDRGRGPVATVLVQNGTLKVGDPIVAGMAFGRVRAMMDDKGRRVTEAGPSQPVEVLGFGEVPSAGDVMNVAEADKLTRQVAEERRDKVKVEQLKNMSKVSLDDLFNQIAAGNVKDLNIIVKADVQGSVEAIKQALEKLSNDEVHVCCIHGGVGAITGSDVMFASASNALVIGFNVRPDATAREAAEKEKVDVRTYSVIYNVIADVETAMKGMFAPVFKENALGSIEVRSTFKVSGVGTIAGAYVKDGKVARSAQVRVVRGGIVIHEGKIASLKRFKDDAKEVATGYECGIGIENFNDVQVGDIIEAFVMEQIER